MIANGDDLTKKLIEFNYWYNAVRQHSYLDGKTPDEVWNNVDVFPQGYKRAIWYEKWDGLLTGFLFKNLINKPARKERIITECCCPRASTTF